MKTYVKAIIGLIGAVTVALISNGIFNHDRKLEIRVYDINSKKPINNATVKLNNDTKPTGNDGIVVFSKLSKGYQNFTISKENYKEYKGTTKIEGNENLKEAKLEPDDSIPKIRQSDNKIEPHNGGNGVSIEPSSNNQNKKEVVSKPKIEDNISDANILDVSLKYGFTKDGVFYIHKSLIPTSNGDDNLYLCYDKNNWSTSNTKMLYDGNYYYYQSKIKQNSGSIAYCFYCSEIKKWMPQYLLNENEETPLINKSDIVWNSEKNGHNFETKPQNLFPGAKH